MAGSHEVRGSIPLCSTTVSAAGASGRLPLFHIEEMPQAMRL